MVTQYSPITQAVQTNLVSSTHVVDSSSSRGCNAAFNGPDEVVERVLVEARDVNLATDSELGRPTTSSHSSGPRVTPRELEKPRTLAYMVNSPYSAEEHQLYLPSLDLQSQLFAHALTYLAPATFSYATAPYIQALNWSHVLAKLKDLCVTESHTWSSQTFYIVEFRSQLNVNIDRELLFKLDQKSHREATESGGLLKYWFGVPDENRNNLATCLWKSREYAIAGGKGPWHQRARSVISKMYEHIDVSSLQITIGDNVTSWSFDRLSRS